MRTVNVLEAKTTLSALLAEVEAGGKVTFARPARQSRVSSRSTQGRSRPIEIGDGRIRISDDFDTFVPDELEF